MGNQGVEFHPQITDISEVVGRAVELNNHGYKVSVTRLKDYYNLIGWVIPLSIKSSDFLITYWS